MTPRLDCRLDDFIEEQTILCALARKYLKAKDLLVTLFGAQAFKVSASMDLVIVFYFQGDSRRGPRNFV